jgi:hypothetical protein
VADLRSLRERAQALIEADRFNSSTSALIIRTESPALIRDLLAEVERLTSPPAVLRVGEALARGEVQDGSHVVEFNDDGVWRQYRVDLRAALLVRAYRQGVRGTPPVPASAWFAWHSTGYDNPDGAEVWSEDFAKAARLVALADADAPPESRGAL